MNSFFCSCARGFSGSVCSANINECASTPCQNGGTCVDQTNSFFCTCAAGYSGLLCSANINECASNPCQNGGTCVDQTNAFSCTCAGYSGTLCTADINECATNNGGCGPGRQCSNSLGSYSCVFVNQVVFVSSTTYNGNLGGTSGADATCLSLANAATGNNLAGRTWVSWTCGTSSTAATRVTNPGGGQYIRPDGTVVALDATNFKSASGHLAAISIDENGVDQSGGVTAVWTGCTATGSLASSHCLSWSDGTSAQTGRAGLDTIFSSGQWTTSGTSSCDTSLRIYCVENS